MEPKAIPVVFTPADEPYLGRQGCAATYLSREGWLSITMRRMWLMRVW